MPPNLVPEDPLSQVVFVHNYVQLVFQGATFTCYNILQLVASGHDPLQQQQPGFADGLVHLIGQRVEQVTVPAWCVLELKFEDGTLLRLLNDESSTRGAEAFQFTNCNGIIVVEPNY